MLIFQKQKEILFVLNSVKYFKELESQTSIEIESLKDQIRTVSDQLEQQKQNKESMEHDFKSLRQQLDYSQEDAYKQKSNLSSRIQEREAEIERLRSQVKFIQNLRGILLLLLY